MKTTATNGQFSAFLWPDRVIGKRESRRIRDEHNALYNAYHEFMRGEGKLTCLEFTDADHATAHKLANALHYADNFAYTSTSQFPGVVGYMGLDASPEMNPGRRFCHSHNNARSNRVFLS